MGVTNTLDQLIENNRDRFKNNEICIQLYKQYLTVAYSKNPKKYFREWYFFNSFPSSTVQEWENWKKFCNYMDKYTYEQYQLDKNKVIIYTLKSCGKCKDLKQYLNDYNIPYVERQINKSNDYIYDIARLGVGIPYILIGDSHAISGFNEKRLNEIFRI